MADKGKGKQIAYPGSNLEEIRTENWVDQQLRGDCLPADHASILNPQINVSFDRDDVSRLKAIWESWDDHPRQLFENKYGCIARLLKVEVDLPLLRALLQFWDPSYRCFTLNEVDLVPTAEEYQQLLRTGGFDKVYWKNGKTNHAKKLSDLVGITKEEADNRIRDKGTMCVEMSFLLQIARGDPKIKFTQNAFALMVYGIVLFPKARNHLDLSVVEMVAEMAPGKDPSTAILAETLLSLNHCRRSRQGTRFRGCSQLFYIWAVSHLKQIDPSCFFGDYIEEVNSTFWIRKTKEEWVENFHNFTPKDVIWRARWMKPTNARYLSRDKPWVPLIGPWGMISYSPLLVHRQYGYHQFVPATYGLNTLEEEFANGDQIRAAKELMEEMRGNHRKVIQYKEGDTADPGYVEWQRQRKKDMAFPPRVNPGHPVGPNAEDIVTNLRMENQRLREHIREQELLDAIQALQLEKKDWEEERQRLKDENWLLEYHLGGAQDYGKEKERKLEEARKKNADTRGELIDISIRYLSAKEYAVEDRRELKKRKALISELAGENKELRASNQELQACSRTLQAPNQELRCANEELRAANQALQTANQEFQAANLILQATNQEMQTANQELVRRVQELDESRQQLQNEEQVRITELEQNVASLNKELALLRQAGQVNQAEYAQLLASRNELLNVRLHLEQQCNELRGTSDAWRKWYLMKADQVEYLLRRLEEAIVVANDFENQARRMKAKLVREQFAPDPMTAAKRRARIRIFLDSVIEHSGLVVNLHSLVHNKMREMAEQV